MSEPKPTTSIRDGESFDVNSLENYLRKELPQYAGRLEVKQFPGGHSNLTYLVQCGDEEWVLRRPPLGSKVKGAHDMEREYRVLNALAPVFPYAPRPVLFGEDESVVGARFLLMECRRGTVVRKEVPEGMTITKEMAEMLCRNMIKTLYRLHILDYKAIGLEDFGKPTGYIRRQVEGWIKRYQAAMTPDAPTCDDIMAWLTAHIPSDSANPGLVHGDFKLDNILLDPDDPVNITGILDWEMATIGDPIADLAYALIYWKEENDPHPPPYDTMPPVVGTAVTREEMLSYYEELSGRIIANTDFYYCFNLFRLGAIIQQIYFRYHHRLTCDKRFGDLKKITAKLMQAAKKYVNR